MLGNTEQIRLAIKRAGYVTVIIFTVQRSSADPLYCTATGNVHEDTVTVGNHAGEALMRKILLIAAILSGLVCFACSDNSLPTWNGSASQNGGGGTGGDTHTERTTGGIVKETVTVNRDSITRDSITIENR